MTVKKIYKDESSQVLIDPQGKLNKTEAFQNYYISYFSEDNQH